MSKDNIYKEVLRREMLIKSHPNWSTELSKAKSSESTIEYLKDWIKREDVLRKGNDS